jgi:hypothetical protein
MRSVALGLLLAIAAPGSAQVAPSSPASPEGNADAPVAEPAGDPGAIRLICRGSGAAERASAVTAFGATSTGTTAFGSMVGRRSVEFGDAVRVYIPPTGKGSIRMPRAMLPRIHGGNKGWFWIDDLKRGQNEITGTVQVSILNSPKVRIDRIDGSISISGRSGDYSGSCEPYDPATVQRKF